MNEPHMAPWWFPANDHPLDKARIRVSITVPKRYDVVSNGRRVHRRTHGAPGDHDLARGRADGALPRLLRGRPVPDRARACATAGPGWSRCRRRCPTAAQPGAMRLMRQTPAITALARGPARRLPVLDRRGPGHQPRPGLRAREPDPADVLAGAASTGPPWSTSSRTSGSATPCRGPPLERHLAQRGRRDVHGVAVGRGPRRASAAERGCAAATTAPTPTTTFWAHQVADPCPTARAASTEIFADVRLPARGDDAPGAAQPDRRRRLLALLRRWVADREGGNGSTAQFEALAEEVSGEDLDGFFAAWLHSATKPADTAANGLG